MFKLNNELLEELGLGALPPAEKNRMLRHIYETLEMRVGMKLAGQMNPQQLEDFERFVDGDIAYARSFLDSSKPGWEVGEAYQNSLNAAKEQAQKANRPLNENAVISEFAALTWLETNFPTYKDVVAEELEKLKTEIRQNAAQIVAMSQQAPPEQPPAAA